LNQPKPNQTIPNHLGIKTLEKNGGDEHQFASQGIP
jgi:hypothetical protein